jgi:HK97 family phage major capsid protein
VAEITRAQAATLIGSQKATEIIKPATEQSVSLATFRTIPMSKKTLSQPMLASLPDAHFVTDGTSDAQSAASGTKPTTDASWTSKSMTAEEIAVIVPIHENLLADADVDLWAEIRPLIAEAFALRLDNAIFYGTEAPASWTDANIVGKAVTAGNIVQRGTLAAQGGRTADLADEFNALFARVEDDGYDVNTVFARKSLRSSLRGLRDAQGAPLYLDNVRSDGATPSVYGETLRYVHKRVQGTVDPDGAGAQAAKDVLAIALDASQFQIGIREDFTMKFLDQATVNGINLAERDMVAMRFKFRVAFGSFRTPLLHDGADYPVSALVAA